MRFLIILLIVLGIIGLLLLCPVVFKLTYEDEFKVKLKFLFLNITLYPKKEKEDSKSNPESNSKKEKKKDKQEKSGIFKKKIKSEGIGGFISLLSDSLKRITEIPVYLKKHICISNFDINIGISSDDAADTAVNYGRTCALIYPFVSVIANNFKYKKLNVDIYPDFDKNKSDINLKIFLKIKLIFLLIALIKGIITGVDIFNRFNTEW